MSKNNITRQNNYNQLLREIRPFVSFDYNLNEKLTKSQRAKITKYHKVIDRLKARPNYVYRPRKKDRLQKAQNFAQHQEKLPDLKVAFIPTQGGEKPTIKFNKKNQLSISDSTVTNTLIELDPQELMADPEGHIKEQINDVGKFESYTISAGAYEIPIGIRTVDLLTTEIINLMEKYGDEKKNNYFGQWLHSVRGYNFKNQASFGAYLNVKQKNKQKLQLDRKNARRRNIRNKNK
tara:strand:+ start:6242 stop:6946 length:705 start_codon:yes stop_codon:yes gene_type:complete